MKANIPTRMRALGARRMQRPAGLSGAWRQAVRRLAFCLLLVACPTLLFAPVNDERDSDTNGTSATIQSALLAAGRNALKQGSVSNAVFYYTRYLQQQPADRSVALEFAGVLTQAGRFEEALAACDQILRADPANPEAQKLKAGALGRLGRAREAQRLIEDLRARFPQDVELQKTEAGFRAMQGDRQFSRDLYRDLLLAGFNNAKDWQDYLQLLAADQQWELLLETYEKYRSRLAVNDDIRFVVLKAYLACHEWPKVESLYQELGSVERRREAAFMIADQLAAAGRLDEAVRFLEPALDPADPDPNLVSKLVLLEAYRKRPVRALKRLDAMPRERHNERANITRAKVFWAAGRPGDALAELDRLALPDTHVEATLARAGLLYDLHREWDIPPLLARLSADLQKGGGPDRKLALCLTALAYIRTGDGDSARRVIVEFQKLEPEDLSPDILRVLTEKAARRQVAYEAAVAQLGLRLRDYQPGAELIRPALLEDVPAEAWRQAWNTRPSNAFLLIKGADAALREGRIQDAAHLYELASSKPGTLVDGLLGMANCALRKGELDAVKRIAQALRDHAMDFPQLAAASRIMLKAGLDGLAESFFARIQPENLDHPDALVIRAAWLVRCGRAPEAGPLLAGIDPTGPAQVGILTYQFSRLADLALNADDPVYALARDRLLALAHWGEDPGVLDGTFTLVDVLLRYGEYDKAREILKRVETRFPRDLRVSERLLTAEIRLGHYLEAETQARKILARRPGDSDRRGLLARMCVWQSDYPLAWRRYQELIADYPEDTQFPLELNAKQNRALSRHRRAAPLYAEYVAQRPDDQEMAVEEGDAWFLPDFNKAAATRYQAATWAFPDDVDVKRSLQVAQRRSHWGVYGEGFYLAREGHDNKVDVKQSTLEGGVRMPRGPDGMTIEAGAGAAQFRFDDPRAESLSARRLAAQGRQLFSNGWDVAGHFETLDYTKNIDSSWRADLDAGYRGLDGWKVAAIAGRQDVRDNYYTILDGLQSSGIGAYGQWQPTERIVIFGQYQMIEIDAPHAGALAPTNAFSRTTTTQTVGKTTVVIPGVTPSTWEKNRAYEGVAEASYLILFAPHSLRLWVNGYRYETEKINDMYWTPDDAFLSGQVGLHWRHTLGERRFVGAPLFFYGVYGAIGRNTEGDSSPTLKGELGWNNGGGWNWVVDGGHIWGDKYEETSAQTRLEYLF